MKLWQRGQQVQQQVQHGFDEEHTPERPYCGRLDCWCHLDWQYHDAATQPLAMSDEELSFALAFLTGGAE